MREQAVQELKKWRRLGERGWSEMLQRFDGAGVTVDEFCRREGVSKSSFARWRSMLAKAPSKPAGQPRGQPHATAMASRFVDLGALPGAVDESGRLQLKIDLGGGLVLQLTRG